MTEKQEGPNDSTGGGPTIESLEKRGRKVREDGVVEGKDWNAIVFGVCGAGMILTILLVHFL